MNGGIPPLPIVALIELLVLILLLLTSLRTPPGNADPLILSFLHLNGPSIETLRHVRTHASLNLKFSNVSGV